MLDIQFMEAIARFYASRIAAHAGNERGEVTEKVLTTAIFAALAIAAGAVIVAKVTAKANSIPTE